MSSFPIGFQEDFWKSLADLTKRKGQMLYEWPQKACIYDGIIQSKQAKVQLANQTLRSHSQSMFQLGCFSPFFVDSFLKPGPTFFLRPPVITGVLHNAGGLHTSNHLSKSMDGVLDFESQVNSCGTRWMHIFFLIYIYKHIYMIRYNAPTM